MAQPQQFHATPEAKGPTLFEYGFSPFHWELEEKSPAENGSCMGNYAGGYEDWFDLKSWDLLSCEMTSGDNPVSTDILNNNAENQVANLSVVSANASAAAVDQAPNQLIFMPPVQNISTSTQMLNLGTGTAQGSHDMPPSTEVCTSVAQDARTVLPVIPDVDEYPGFFTNEWLVGPASPQYRPEIQLGPREDEGDENMVDGQGKKRKRSLPNRRCQKPTTTGPQRTSNNRVARKNQDAKNSREKLKAEMERLRVALPQHDGFTESPKLTRKIVLAIAVDYIQQLETENKRLETENARLAEANKTHGYGKEGKRSQHLMQAP